MIKFTEVTLRDMMEPFMHVLFSVQENMTRQFAKVEALDNSIAGINYVKIKRKDEEAALGLLNDLEKTRNDWAVVS